MSHNSHSFEEKEVKKKPFGTRFRAVLYLSLVAPAALGTFALGQLENITFFIRVVCLAPQFYRFRILGLFIFLRAQPCRLSLIIFFLKKILHLHSTGTW